MSDSVQSRRTFLKGSLSKSLIAANAGIVVGLINTPGVVDADTTGPGTTQPATTASPFSVSTSGGQITNASTGQFKFNLHWSNGPGTAYMSVTYYKSNNPSNPLTFTWQETCGGEEGGEERTVTISPPIGTGLTLSSINTPVASTTPPD